MEISDRDREMVAEFRAAVDTIANLLNEAQSAGLSFTYDIDYQKTMDGRKVYYGKVEAKKVEAIYI